MIDREGGKVKEYLEFPFCYPLLDKPRFNVLNNQE